jgi:pyruvate dehydrogenase E2 component (dihydrolipoamide acetyltransferase)
MPINILMPALSPTMTEGNLAKWVKKEGQTIKAGDILCEIETDKATMEVEAVDEGILGKIIIQAGAENVPVNTLIAIMLEDGEDASALSLTTQETPSILLQENKFIEENNIPTPKIAVPQQAILTNRVIASPLAKRIAAQNNIDLSKMSGSGPNNRIVKADLEKILTSPPKIVNSASPFEDVKLTMMRKTIAKRLTESKNTVPHFYLTVDCEIDALLNARKAINETSKIKTSVNDLLIKICSKTLIEVPHTNVTWHDSFVRYHKQTDISIAVAIDGGLVTPIVFNAEQLSIQEISKTVKLLVEKARDGKLKTADYEGGTFTLSNLGMYGIKQFNAIVNPPQGCILAVGGGEKRLIIKDDKPHVATIMTVTLSVDHRSVDGALGAEFLKVFKKYVENPIFLFV